jgi:hypothetical protein
VTRLGESSPMGRLFSLDSFVYKILSSFIFGLLFNTAKFMY